MAKKYNILNDKNSIRNILEELVCFCDVHTSCLYCPFHNGNNHCLLVVNGRTPIEYFEEEDDDE